MRNIRGSAARTGLLAAAGIASIIAVSTLPAAAQDYYNGGSRYGSEQPYNPNYDYQRNYDRSYSDNTQNREWQDRSNDRTFDVPMLGLRFHSYDQNDRNWNHAVLSRSDIRHQLVRQDFRHFSNWHLNNGVYRLSAEDGRGRDVRLMVNAYNGRILDVRRDR